MIEFNRIEPSGLVPDRMLSGAVIVGIVVLAAAISAGAAVRWEWKGWPLALLSGLALPILTPLTVAAGLYFIDYERGEAGSMSFDLQRLILFTGIAPSLVGFAGALSIVRTRSKRR